MSTSIGRSAAAPAALASHSDFGTTHEDTNSTSPVDIPDMAITPGAGTYLAMFNTSAVLDGTSEAWFDLAVDGTWVPNSEMSVGIK